MTTIDTEAAASIFAALTTGEQELRTRAASGGTWETNYEPLDEDRTWHRLRNEYREVIQRLQNDTQHLQPAIHQRATALLDYSQIGNWMDPLNVLGDPLFRAIKPVLVKLDVATQQLAQLPAPKTPQESVVVVNEATRKVGKLIAQRIIDADSEVTTSWCDEGKIRFLRACIEPIASEYGIPEHLETGGWVELAREAMNTDQWAVITLKVRLRNGVTTINEGNSEWLTAAQEADDDIDEIEYVTYELVDR